MRIFKKKYWYLISILTIINIGSCLSVTYYILTHSLKNAPSMLNLFIVEILFLITGLSLTLLLLFFSMLFYANTETGMLEQLRLSVLRSPKFIRQIIEHIGISGRLMAGGIIVVIIAVIISISCLYIWNFYAGDPNPDLTILRSSGILFTIFMAIVTILGFVLTVNKVAENNSLITNYHQLLDTAKDIINKATEEGGACIKMLGATPCHGNYSERETKVYKDYHNLIENIQKNDSKTNGAYLDLICYDVDEWTEDESSKSPLQLFYEQYDKGNNKRKDAFEEAKTMYYLIKNQKARVRNSTIASDVHKVEPVKQKAGLPSYRLLITNKAAICYFPVDISFSTNHNGDDSERLKRVEMLGFSTKVGYIVDWLNLHFDHIKHEVKKSNC
jgi:hypothetical protein